MVAKCNAVMGSSERETQLIKCRKTGKKRQKDSWQSPEEDLDAAKDDLDNCYLSTL